MGKKHVSIVICSLGREESLLETLESLDKQEYKSFEVVLITEKGHLSSLRQKGLEASIGKIVVFIDDDVVCPPLWLKSIVSEFEPNGVVGVTGPTVIPEQYRENRDLFKYKLIKKLYDSLFLKQARYYPAHLSFCGANSTVSNDYRLPNGYSFKCDYLEACNMAVLKEVAIKAGGFSDKYTYTSEWCEVDLALRMKFHGRLIFSSSCGLEHHPSKEGVYKDRLSTEHRWKNFIRFQHSHCYNYKLYRSFVWIYLKLKSLKIV